jgi:hypothetical protein
VVNPDIIVLIDCDSADIADHPVMGQGKRPRGIDNKSRRATFVLDSHAFGHAVIDSRLLESVLGGCAGLLCVQRRRQARYAEQNGKQCWPDYFLYKLRNHRGPLKIAMAYRIATPQRLNRLRKNPHLVIPKGGVCPRNLLFLGSREEKQIPRFAWFTVNGMTKSVLCCHSERSEESLFLCFLTVKSKRDSSLRSE